MSLENKTEEIYSKVINVDFNEDFEDNEDFVDDNVMDIFDDDYDFNDDGWGDNPFSESVDSDINKVDKVTPCEIDKQLYRTDLWEKAFKVLLKKKLSADAYNELFQLQGDIENFVNSIFEGQFAWGIPKKIQIPKENGKMRTVYMFNTKQRVLLGMLNRVLSEVFADKISPVCYSYKTGVSTITAVREIRNTAYKGTTRVFDYALKLDISKYFNSVSEERITEMLNTLFTEDNRGVIYELLKVLFSINFVYDKGVLINEYLSIIPGVATASFFANYCLYDVDEHFRELGIPYARYCDDIILFAETNEQLQGHIQYIEGKLQESGLTINNDKYCYYDLNNEDVEFLGLKFDNDKIDISEKSFKKIKKKIKHACKLARKDIEMHHKPKLEAITSLISKFNYIWYKCYVFDRSRFGWGYYAFRFITTDETLRQIDYYFRDTLRYVYTGKYNKANWHKLTNEKLNELGYVSLTYMYGIFKSDFEVYLDYVASLK